MSFRQLLKPRSHCSRVRLSSLTQILKSLLPKLLNIRKMPNVLGNGPLAFDLVVRSVLPHSLKQRPESWNEAAKAFDEVREHPRRVHKRERAVWPARPNQARTHEITIPLLANALRFSCAPFQAQSRQSQPAAKVAPQRLS